MHATLGVLKRLSDIMDLELEMFVSFHGGAGT